MNCDGKLISLGGGNATLDLSDASDEDVKGMFYPEGLEKRDLKGSLKLVESKLTILPLRLQWRKLLLRFQTNIHNLAKEGHSAIIENNQFLTKIEHSIEIEATGTLVVKGNRRLDEASIETLKDRLHKGLGNNPPDFKDSYIQDFGGRLDHFP